MCPMGYQTQLPKLRSFRRLMYLSPVITILSLTLLLWSYRPARTLKFWSQYYQVTSPAQIPVQHTLPRGSDTVPTGSDPGPQDLPGEKVPVVAVNGAHTLLVSAYLEHRTARREVRVIAVVLRSETVAYFCLLRCQGRHHISAGDASIHWDHFGFAYGTATILCPLPSGCVTPSHVAVTSVAAAASEGEGEVFLEVRNQEARTDFPYNFTVCISTMFNFTNVLQLVQSMEMLKILGVSRVVIYKTSCDPDTQRLLDYYTRSGFMEVIPWSNLSKHVNVSSGWMSKHSPGDLHYYGQIPALNDCLYRYMYQSKYLALHDVDELILPQEVESWRELLPLLEQTHGSDYGYMFENAVFPNTIQLPAPTSHTTQPPHRWQGISGVNILAHLYREPLLEEFSNFKIIVNPRAVFATTVHGLLKSEKGCLRVPYNVAHMYHTRPLKRTQLTTDQLVYEDRLLAYSTRLILAVNSVLKETTLIQENA